MKKTELSELLHSVGIQVNEGISSEGKFPRIVYWPYLEEDVMASGEGYENKVTYQVSLFSKEPQGKAYKILRKKLREKGLHPMFQHEYVEKDKFFANSWHTFFSIEVIEEIEDGK